MERGRVAIIRNGFGQKKVNKKLKSIDMEIAIMMEFDIRRNLIVPNVYWGMFRHECDLISITQAGYATEIEIKVTKSDLMKDLDKKHCHNDPKISYLFFAIPDYMKEHIEYIPDRAGIILVDQNLSCNIIRPSKQQNKYKFTMEEKYQIARLGAMRILGLKKRLQTKLPNKTN